MALAPRSSLRSLVLLMSHGKPQLSAFFSSAATTAAPKAAKPPAAPAGDSPATDPPAAAASSSGSGSTHSAPLECPSRRFRHVELEPEPEGSYHTLGHETDKIPPGATKDPEGPISEGSCGTPQPVSDDPQPGPRKDPRHRVPEDP
ncbi:hypothetical protein CFC21_103731 [Triticum aestivum]|uniref:Uncharacterized protein n=3 Tax=Triticum TaxID=4564 RepID=A0A9R1A4T3_TRITD|nr:serine/threonine-protein kinase LMTK3-like [Triticum aestivum]KAF7102629.1 hypothetical protein CFC21_103731 [Triticum aestivum]VAI89569.1 unnamed protein product [Triticum turgidum subsp. durum]